MNVIPSVHTSSLILFHADGNYEKTRFTTMCRLNHMQQCFNIIDRYTRLVKEATFRASRNFARALLRR